MSNETENTNVSQEATASSEQKIATPFHFACSPTVHISAGVALFLVGGLVAMLVDPYLPTLLSNTKKSEARGHTLGFAEAKARVDNSTLGQSIKSQSNTSTSRTLNGTVTNVGQGKITLNIRTNDPFADAASSNRTVLVNASTTINLISQKKSTQKITVGGSQMALPSTQITKIPLGDVRTGDIVSTFLTQETLSQPEPTAAVLQVLPRTEVKK